MSHNGLRVARFALTAADISIFATVFSGFFLSSIRLFVTVCLRHRVCASVCVGVGGWP